MSNSSESALKWLQLDKDEKPDNFYACLGAVLSSTFLVLHLNVPPPRERHDSHSRLRRLWNAEEVVQIRRHLCWAAIVLVAPELLVSLAYSDWRAALNDKDLLQTFGRGSASAWGKVHASFLNMSGVRLEMYKVGKSSQIDRIPVEDAKIFEQLLSYTTTRQMPLNRALRKCSLWYRALKGQIALMGSVLPCRWRKKDRRASLPEHPADLDKSHPDAPADGVQMHHIPCHHHEEEDLQCGSEGQETEAARAIAQQRDHATYGSTSHSTPQIVPSTETIILYLNARQFVTAQILGLINDLPELTERVIRDKSHTPALLKLPAIAPLLWFVVRLIVKKLCGRHICQLELASTTYIFCCLTAYIFTWSKPQGVEQPLQYRIQLSDVVHPVNDIHLSILSFWGGSWFLSRNFWPPFGMDGRQVHPTEPIPTGTSHSVFFVSKGVNVAFFDDDFAGTVSGVFFGALYSLGWDTAQFPSVVERVLWKLAIICIIGSLIPYSIANAIFTAVFRDLQTTQKRVKTHIIHVLVLYSLLGIYVFGRLYMLWGMVREFF